MNTTAEIEKPAATAIPPPRRHRLRLRTGRFRFADHCTLFGHARLYGDRIELSEWGLRGHQRRQIRFDQVVDMDYHPLNEGSNFTITLDDGEQIDLWMEEAHLWRAQFENWMRYQWLASAKVIGETEQVAALAG